MDFCPSLMLGALSRAPSPQRLQTRQQWRCLPPHVTAGCGGASFTFVCQAGALNLPPGGLWKHLCRQEPGGPCPLRSARLSGSRGLSFLAGECFLFLWGQCNDVFRLHRRGLESESCCPSLPWSRAGSARGRWRWRLPAPQEHVEAFGFISRLWLTEISGFGISVGVSPSARTRVPPLLVLEQ